MTVNVPATASASSTSTTAAVLSVTPPASVSVDELALANVTVRRGSGLVAEPPKAGRSSAVAVTGPVPL